MDAPPQRAFRDAELLRAVGIEPSLSRLLHDRKADRRGTAVVDGEGYDLVAASLHGRFRLELRDLDGKRGSLEPETFGPLEHLRRSSRTPQRQPLLTALQGHRSDETDDPEDVVRVQVREKNVRERERNPPTHHLTLGALRSE